jgi:hypothetical protein
VYAGSIPTLAFNQIAATFTSSCASRPALRSDVADALMTIGGGRAILARTK